MNSFERYRRCEQLPKPRYSTPPAIANGCVIVLHAPAPRAFKTMSSSS
jgi:hypothetical protein